MCTVKSKFRAIPVGLFDGCARVRENGVHLAPLPRQDKIALL